MQVDNALPQLWTESSYRIKGRVCKTWRHIELQLRVQQLKRAVDSILDSLRSVDPLLPLLARRARITESELLELLQSEAKSAADALVALPERTLTALGEYNESHDTPAQADDLYAACFGPRCFTLRSTRVVEH